MNIDASAPVHARHDALISAPLPTVWRLLSEIDRWSVWHADVTYARLTGPLAPGSVFRWKSGGFKISSTLEEVTPMSRLAWSGRAIGTRAIHVWELREEPGGVRAFTSESFDGWLIRMMKPSMQRMLDTALVGWLDRLKLAAESGR